MKVAKEMKSGPLLWSASSRTPFRGVLGSGRLYPTPCLLNVTPSVPAEFRLWRNVGREFRAAADLTPTVRAPEEDVVGNKMARVVTPAVRAPEEDVVGKQEGYRGSAWERAYLVVKRDGVEFGGLPPWGSVEQNGWHAELGNRCARSVGSGSMTLWPLEQTWGDYGLHKCQLMT